MDTAAPPLTINEFAALCGRDPRQVKRWIKTGVVPTEGQQAAWPFRTLIPYDALLIAAKRQRWGKRRKHPKTLTTTEGRAVRFRGMTRTDSWQDDYPITRKEE